MTDARPRPQDEGRPFGAPVSKSFMNFDQVCGLFGLWDLILSLYLDTASSGQSLHTRSSDYLWKFDLGSSRRVWPRRLLSRRVEIHGTGGRSIMDLSGIGLF